MSVDFWAVGILIYEMLFGQTPFFSQDESQIASQIQYKELTFPDESHSPQVRDLI